MNRIGGQGVVARLPPRISCQIERGLAFKPEYRVRAFGLTTCNRLIYS